MAQVSLGKGSGIQTLTRLRSLDQRLASTNICPGCPYNLTIERGIVVGLSFAGQAWSPVYGPPRIPSYHQFLWEVGEG